MKNVLFVFFVVIIIFISGCTKTVVQTKYVCPDGSTVNSSIYCPKKTATTQTGNVTEETKVIYTCVDGAID